MEPEDRKIEEQAEEQDKRNTWLTKAKSAFNRAKLSRYLGFIAIIVGTTVISLYQVGWDPWRIGWQTYIANTALLLFLGIYGLFFGENEGTNLFKSLSGGLYQIAKGDFVDKVEEINEEGYTDALPDYITWRYQKDYDNACKMRLMSVRMFDYSVLKLSDENLQTLRTRPLNIGDSYYSQLSDEQYEAVMDVKHGKVFVDYIDDYTFFLNESDPGEEQQVTRVKNTPKRKEKITWKQRGSRVLMIVVFSLILAGFFKQAWEGDSDTAKRDLLSRLVTLIVSVASGMNTARLTNMEDVFVLNFKVAYDSLFLSCMRNKTFVPTDYKAKAKEEYEKYEKEQEEARASVVEPESSHIPMLGGNGYGR